MSEMLTLFTAFTNVPGSVSPSFSSGIISAVETVGGSQLVWLSNSGNFIDFDVFAPSTLPTSLRLKVRAAAAISLSSPAIISVGFVRDDSGHHVNLNSPTVTIAEGGSFADYTLDVAINGTASTSDLGLWQFRLIFYFSSLLYVDQLTIEADPEGIVVDPDIGPGGQKSVNASNFEMYCAL